MGDFQIYPWSVAAQKEGPIKKIQFWVSIIGPKDILTFRFHEVWINRGINYTAMRADISQYFIAPTLPHQAPQTYRYLTQTSSCAMELLRWAMDTLVNPHKWVMSKKSCKIEYTIWNPSQPIIWFLDHYMAQHTETVNAESTHLSGQWHNPCPEVNLQR